MAFVVQCPSRSKAPGVTDMVSWRRSPGSHLCICVLLFAAMFRSFVLVFRSSLLSFDSLSCLAEMDDEATADVDGDEIAAGITDGAHFLHFIPKFPWIHLK